MLYHTSLCAFIIFCLKQLLHFIAFRDSISASQSIETKKKKNTCSSWTSFLIWLILFLSNYSFLSNQLDFCCETSFKKENRISNELLLSFSWMFITSYWMKHKKLQKEYIQIRFNSQKREMGSDKIMMQLLPNDQWVIKKKKSSDPLYACDTNTNSRLLFDDHRKRNEPIKQNLCIQNNTLCSPVKTNTKGLWQKNCLLAKIKLLDGNDFL